MLGHEQFSNPPIIEALLDIQVELPANIDLPRIEGFKKYVASTHPIVMKKNQWQTSFQLGNGDLPEIRDKTGGTIGYQYLAADRKNIIQARLDGFTVNLLRPYSNWDDLQSEAKARWREYCEIATPLSVTRLALRYINKIEIPMPIADFKEYLLTVPDVPSGIPQALSNFFMRVAIPNPKTQDIAFVTVSMEGELTPAKCLPIIFDIDVFRQVDLPPDDGKMWEVFNTLREYKNDIFFASITQKTREMFR
jgi:uncharacterized protein (TIGR04255 family)